MNLYATAHAVLALAASLSLAAAEQHQDSGAFRPEWSVIFTAEQMASFAAGQKRPTRFEGFWTPSRGDVDQFERLIAPQLTQEISRHQTVGDTSLLRVNEYYRQYIGVLDGGVQRLIANGFHSAFVESRRDRPADFWKHELTGAFDGGCMFFHAAYDVAKRAFEGLACQRDPLQETIDAERNGQPP